MTNFFSRKIIQLIKNDVVNQASFADVGGDGDESGLIECVNVFERVGIDDAEVIEFDAGVFCESLFSCQN